MMIRYINEALSRCEIICCSKRLRSIYVKRMQELKSDYDNSQSVS